MPSALSVSGAAAAVQAVSLGSATAARADCASGVYDEPLPPSMVSYDFVGTRAGRCCDDGGGCSVRITRFHSFGHY